MIRFGSNHSDSDDSIRIRIQFDSVCNSICDSVCDSIRFVIQFAIRFVIRFGSALLLRLNFNQLAWNSAWDSVPDLKIRL